MDVELYVYDLSKGLARQISASLLGTQIEAVYHTSIVMGGIEYVYDGGIQTVKPGQTHLGPPMNVLPLGQTELPLDVIMDYLESMKTIFTPQAYDLWKHNCNTFSHDFAIFLIGKGIPEHITNLPDTVLQSPFGRMLKPMIDDKVRAGKQRQAGLLGLADEQSAKTQPKTSYQHLVAVKLPITPKDLATHLKAAERSCAVIFFTSSTCGPCRPLYPIYEELAQEAGPKSAVIKVDIGRSQEIARQYQITATPTFITFLHGKQERRWMGADQAQLRGNVQSLVQMAWPPHPHENLKLPVFRNADLKPVLYTKVPPLEKLMVKLGNTGKNPVLKSVQKFIHKSQTEGAADAPIPDLDAFSLFLRSSVSDLPQAIMFAIVDLLRVVMADPRISGYFAEENEHKTMRAIFNYVNEQEGCPYSLRLVALQTGCNLFSSPLYVEHVLGCESLTKPLVQLITTSLLDEIHHNVRVAASSLAFNIAVSNSQCRTVQMRNVLPDEEQVELAASLLEAINVEEESAEALKGFLLTLGHLIFCANPEGELFDLLRSMDAGKTVTGKAKQGLKEPLIQEIGAVLLGKGLGECHK